MWPRRKSVVKFHLTTGHDCLLKHLHRILAAHASFCTLCDFREDMDADHIRCCPTLKGLSLCNLYWQARDLLGSWTSLPIFPLSWLIMSFIVFVPTLLWCSGLL
ncbi:hypothetical protein TNCV_249031 [Trichonephila clavipes]|nr:hypothetical protein TNCV_249031 [Trichonephila clavipes]